MPKEVHDLVNKLLRKKDFYPEKSEEDRKSTAWAIATEQIKKKHHKSSYVLEFIKCASILDELGFYKEADQVIKLAQNRSWWQNEAGEPMYSPEAIRAEESHQHEPEYDPDSFLSEGKDDDDGWEQSDLYNDIFDHWAKNQDQSTLEMLNKKFNHPELGQLDPKAELEELILGDKRSRHHKKWDKYEPTISYILEAVKNAILNDSDIMEAINSIPGYSYS